MSIAVDPNKASANEAARAFDWPLANEAEALIRGLLADFLRHNSFAPELSIRMRDETGTDVFEWVDHVVIGPGQEAKLSTAGFLHDSNAETPNGEVVYENPQATLPRIVVRKGQRLSPSVVALKPEFVAEFIANHNLTTE